MRKKSLSVLLCMAMLVFGSAALTGCGNKDSETGGSSDRRTEGSTREQSNESSDEAKVPENESGNAGAAYTTLEGYFTTPEGAEDLAAFKEGLEGDGISMDVEGDVVICTYSLSDVTLADYSEEDRAAIMAEMNQSMPETMESLSDYFVPSVEYFEEASGLKGVVFKVVYTDSNGELLYEHEFTSK